MSAYEVNFDGIVGPTHNYAGLSFGNIASTSHMNRSSSPRQAALQGLEKMRFVHSLGIPQAVLPPLRRPRLELLRDLGYSGSDTEVVDAAWKSQRSLVAACFSASNMWTANAATVSPSPDCGDNRLHLTPANLQSGLHRSIEADETTRMLRAVFPDADRFVVHEPLPANTATSDEGAANHTRLCVDYADFGVEVFVFGRSAFDQTRPVPIKFPARQTLEASEAIARRHRLDARSTLMIQQLPAAIDAGVFHNDVISVGNRNYFLYHEQAFVDTQAAVSSIRAVFVQNCGDSLFTTCITNAELSMIDAVKSYLFNSQLLSRPDGGMTLLCPVEVRELASAKSCTDRILQEDNPVDSVEFLDLRQSMYNGGGPACLRLRIVLTDDALESLNPGVRFTATLYEKLKDWVNDHYRNELAPDDLCDPQLIHEVDAAFVELATILQLPLSVFRFQS
ncbi:MAG: N-succinylarginine dihydrolase [Pirellulaceae bacterium]